MKIFSKFYKKILSYFFFIIYGKISANQNNFDKKLIVKKKYIKIYPIKFLKLTTQGFTQTVLMLRILPIIQLFQGHLYNFEEK